MLNSQSHEHPIHATPDLEKQLQRLVSQGKESDDTNAAAEVVNLISRHDDMLQPGQPASSLIYELAASLELPDSMTGFRAERWLCIEALLAVLHQQGMAFKETSEQEG